MQSFDLGFGTGWVCYPEATEDRGTIALLIDVDPVRLVRGPTEGLDQYVNDRPYAASSFLSVAIATIFGTALAGRSKDRPEAVEAALPLEARIHALPSRGEGLIFGRLFEPLGYTVAVDRQVLDPAFPAWGDSRHFTVDLGGTVRLRDLLAHLYVLIPVLDDDKHYWVGDDEVEKLLRHGAAWLPNHPKRSLITIRYLRHQRVLTRAALERMAESADPDAEAATAEEREEAIERPIRLHDQPIGAVLAALRASGATSVVDLGCGEGRLLLELITDSQFQRIVGIDVSVRSLEVARDRLKLDRLSDARRAIIRLLHGALTYRDSRLDGFDAAAAVEVIEHLDPSRLVAFEQVVFGSARPTTVIVTTPNREYNVRFPTLPVGNLRHRDHRFEWTRAEFADWASGVAGRHGYQVSLDGIGSHDAEVGTPSQIAIFRQT